MFLADYPRVFVSPNLKFHVVEFFSHEDYTRRQPTFLCSLYLSKNLSRMLGSFFKSNFFPRLLHVCCFFSLVQSKEATYICHHACHVAFSVLSTLNKQHNSPSMPRCVAFAVLMLHERQHAAAFILLLLLFTTFGSSIVPGEVFPSKILAHFASCKAFASSDEVFRGEFLLVLPPVRPPILLVRYSAENYLALPSTQAPPFLARHSPTSSPTNSYVSK